jgi:septum formation protein
MTPLVLASTSPYRKELLAKLALDFSAQAPLCDEDSFKEKIKDPKALAQTLAREKAESLATPDNCVIGGDQLVVFKGEILGKPGDKEKANEQLNRMQGQSHELITAVCVIFRGEMHEILNITRLQMRKLSTAQIQSYVERDLPLDCAGSYKIEKSGITLMENVDCSDFSAIQGLPLIALVKILTKLGFPV